MINFLFILSLAFVQVRGQNNFYEISTAQLLKESNSATTVQFSVKSPVVNFPNQFSCFTDRNNNCRSGTFNVVFASCTTGTGAKAVQADFQNLAGTNFGSAQCTTDNPYGTVAGPTTEGTQRTYTCTFANSVIQPDTLVEENECVQLTFTDVDDPTGWSTGSDSTAQLKIDGSEPGAKIQLSTTAGNFPESATAVPVSVSLSTPADAAVTVNVVYTDGNARKDFDYKDLSNGVVTFPQGVVQKDIQVELIRDEILELSETFSVQASVQPGQQLVFANSNKLDITIDASSPENGEGMTFTIPPRSAREGATADDVVLRMDRPAEFGQFVTFTMKTVDSADKTVTSGMATKGDTDFSMVLSKQWVSCTQKTRSQCQNEMEVKFPVTINNDNLLEGTETFEIQLQQVESSTSPVDVLQITNPAQTALDNQLKLTPAAYTIFDDDLATVYIEGGGTGKEVEEGVGSIQFTVVLSKQPAVDIWFATTNVASNCGTTNCPKGLASTTDIGTLDNVVKLPAGQQKQTFSIDILNDNVQEGWETFQISLKRPTLSVISLAQNQHPGKNVGTITDNENPTLQIQNVKAAVPVSEATGGATTPSVQMTFPVMLSHAYDVDVQISFEPDTTSGTGPGKAVWLKDVFPLNDVCGPHAPPLLTPPGPPGAVAVSPCTDNPTPSMPDAVFKANSKQTESKVYIVNDNFEEGDETFQIKVTTPVVKFEQYGPCNGNCYPQIPASGVGTGTISEISRGELATLSVCWGDCSAGAPAVQVVKEDFGKVVFTVKMSHATDTDVVVQYKTVDGNAKQGEDYTQTQGSVTFPKTAQPGRPFTKPALSQTFDVEIKNDEIIESIETFSVQLDVSAKLEFETVLVVKRQTTVEIQSDDVGTVSIVDAKGDEQIGHIDFLVKLSHKVEGRTGVTFTTATPSGFEEVAKTAAQKPQTAAAAAAQANKCSPIDNLDFVDSTAANKNNRLDIPSGQTQGLFSVNLINDNCQERAETFTVTIATVEAVCPSCPGQTVSQIYEKKGSTVSALKIATGDSKAVGTILDAEGTTIKVDTAMSFKEADPGLKRLRVMLSHTVDYPVSVGFEFKSPTATATEHPATTNCDGVTDCELDVSIIYPQANYGGKTGTGFLTFDAQSTENFMIMKIIDDQVVEYNKETSNLVFQSSSSAVSVGYPAGKQSFVLEIEDNDTSKLSIPEVSVAESAGAQAKFQVILSNPVETDVMFEWNTAEGTCDDFCAKAASDYTAQTTTTATIAKLKISKEMTVPLTNDEIQECDETFKIEVSTLFGPGGAATAAATWNQWGKTGENGVTGTPSGIIKITDNEGLYLEGLEQSASEVDKILTWNVKLSHEISNDADITYDTSDTGFEKDFKRAKEGDRYQKTTGTIKFGKNKKQATQQPSVITIDDNKVSPDQSFSLILQKPTRGCPAQLFKNGFKVLTGTVKDNEQATVYVEQQEVPENGNVELTVKLSHGLGSHPKDLKMNWKVSQDPKDKLIGTKAILSDFGLKKKSDASTPLTFTNDADGQEKKVTVSVLKDDLVELKETFTLDFEFYKDATADYHSFSKIVTPQKDAPNLVTIDSQDKATLTVQPAKANFLESDEMFVFNVVLSKGTQQPFNAKVVCKAQGDQKTPDQTLEFKGITGETHEVVLNFPTNDQKVEMEKTFAGLPCKLSLTDAKYAALVTVPADFFAKVTDDDESFLSVAGNTVVEGGKVTFTATLSAAVDTDVKVSYHTETGTANDQDFTAIPSGTPKILTFAAGEKTKTFSIQTTQDELIEGTQYFSVVFTDLEASNRQVKILSSKARGTITDDDEAKISVTVDKKTVTEGQVLSFNVKLSKKTEDAVEFAYTLTGGPMDRRASTAKTHVAVHCVDFKTKHCKNGKLNKASMTTPPLEYIIPGGSDSVKVQVRAEEDGEVDGTNKLTIKLTQILKSAGKLELDTAAKLTTFGLITDTDKTTWSVAAKSKKVNEGQKMSLDIKLTKPFRREATVELSSKSKDLFAELDFPKLNNKKIKVAGGIKKLTLQWVTPDNQQVCNKGTFDMILFSNKKEQDRITYTRLDSDKVTIELDPSQSVLTNIEGGSGLRVAYRLVLAVRSSQNIVVMTGTLPTGGGQLDQEIVFESKKTDFKLNGKTYNMQVVPANVRLLLFDVDGKVSLDEKNILTDQQEKAVKGFPAELVLKKVVPKPVYIPSLCQLPLRASPVDSKSTDVTVTLSPGETNTFYPGSCYYYPEGVTSAVWMSEYKATGAGPKVTVKNPDDDSMSVTVKVSSTKKRTLINLASLGDSPITLQLYDQVDFDVVVADRLFLFECNKVGRKCCNTIQGEDIISKCKVNQKTFRSGDPVWSSGYDYDVSGIVHIGVKATQTGLHRQCFGFAPADNLYPDGFCLTFYVPEAPVINYIANQALVQSTSIEIPLDITSGTWFDRDTPYQCEIHCVKGCTAASAKLKFDKTAKTWSVVILANDVNTGDSQFIVVVKDKWHAVTAPAINVRTVLPAAGGNTC